MSGRWQVVSPVVRRYEAIIYGNHVCHLFCCEILYPCWSLLVLQMRTNREGESFQLPLKQCSRTFITTVPSGAFTTGKSWYFCTPGRSEYFSPRVLCHASTRSTISMWHVALLSQIPFKSPIVKIFSVL